MKNSIKQPLKLNFGLLLILIVLPLSNVQGQDRFVPPPEEATVLFDGTDFSHWTNCDDGEVRWEIVEGHMQVVPDTLYSCERIQGIKTKKNYKDFHLHLEFRLMEPDANSGVYIHRRYEVQIADTYQKEDYKYMGGSIYRQKLPDYNMWKPPGEWQSYDIIFRSPRFEFSELVSRKVDDARITVIHNGIVIHNNVIVHNKTGAGFPETSEPGPIMLQDHGSLVQYRNIWIVSNKKDH